jgi:ribosomal protein S18 acetylase RimI-like enzyme
VDDGYILSLRVPAIGDYLRLRIAAGLTPRSAASAAAGLPNSFLGAVVEKDGRSVGMGRVIGDGGLFFQLVDIAVEPEHQGRGLGKAIVAALVEALKQRVPGDAYVSLIADGEAHRLYAQYGFEPTAPASIGMALWLP